MRCFQTEPFRRRQSIAQAALQNGVELCLAARFGKIVSKMLCRKLLERVALTNAVREVCQWTSRNNGITVTNTRGAGQWRPLVSATRWFSTGVHCPDYYCRLR
jgi:hypothetical protein